jgi:hypothetical protein
MPAGRILSNTHINRAAQHTVKEDLHHVIKAAAASITQDRALLCVRAVQRAQSPLTRASADAGVSDVHAEAVRDLHGGERRLCVSAVPAAPPV